MTHITGRRPEVVAVIRETVKSTAQSFGPSISASESAAGAYEYVRDLAKHLGASPKALAMMRDMHEDLLSGLDALLKASGLEKNCPTCRQKARKR